VWIPGTGPTWWRRCFMQRTLCRLPNRVTCVSRSGGPFFHCVASPFHSFVTTTGNATCAACTHAGSTPHQAQAGRFRTTLITRAYYHVCKAEERGAHGRSVSVAQHAQKYELLGLTNFTQTRPAGSTGTSAVHQPCTSLI